jgi:PIN domain nuclease of toxin-antitoxin system
MEKKDKNLQMFLYVVSSFEMAAMQGLGKINNPVTGKVERNMEQAQFAIDVLDMFKDKTTGNLDEYESRFLDTVTSQLKLNYVDELNKKEPETIESQKESPKDSTEESTEENK